MADITFFTTSLSGGGAQKVFSILARELSARDYDIDFIVIDRGPGKEDLNGVNIVELQADHIRYAVPELVEYLNRESPVTIYSTLAGPNITIMIAGKLFSGDIQIINREATIRSISAERSTGFKKMLENTALKFLYPTADTVVTLSDDAERDLIEFVADDGFNITKIPNPVDIRRIKTQAAEPVAHEWFTERNKVVVGVGRLVPKNDFKTLITAFDEFKSTSRDKLVILGKGREEDRLKSFVRENSISNVEFLGYVENPYKYMARSDVFALTSRYEGMPNTVLEALACGTPVVATDSPGGTSEVLANGQYGKLAEIGEASQISQLLSETLNSEIDQGELKRHAENYSVEKIADAYLDLVSIQP